MHKPAIHEPAQYAGFPLKGVVSHGRRRVEAKLNAFAKDPLGERRVGQEGQRRIVARNRDPDLFISAAREPGVQEESAHDAETRSRTHPRFEQAELMEPMGL